MSKKATAPSWVRIIREPLTQFELAQTARTDHAINTPQAAYDVFRERAEVGLVESFYVATLNSKNKLISLQEVSRGSLNASIVEPREVFRLAILDGAASVIVAHNHPSGDPAPSSEDIAVTRRLVKAGELIGISVHDHIIVGHPSPERQAFASLRELGLM
jgi:DNA repair protein RadC